MKSIAPLEEKVRELTERVGCLTTQLEVGAPHPRCMKGGLLPRFPAILLVMCTTCRYMQAAWACLIGLSANVCHTMLEAGLRGRCSSCERIWLFVRAECKHSMTCVRPGRSLHTSRDTQLKALAG